jgi:hypothetical protein
MLERAESAASEGDLSDEHRDERLDGKRLAEQAEQYWPWRCVIASASDGHAGRPGDAPPWRSGAA